MGKLDSQLKTFKLAEGDLEWPALMKQEIDTVPLANISRMSAATTNRLLVLKWNTVLANPHPQTPQLGR